jgi:hypothetical protein
MHRPARLAGVRRSIRSDGPLLATLVPSLVFLLSACTGEPQPSQELIAVPTQSPGPLFNLGPHGCPAALLEGVLVADEETGFVVEHADGFSVPVVWPHGYVARDGDPRELLDDSGRVVAREGDHFSAGGGSFPPNDWFYPCGEMEFRPGG